MEVMFVFADSDVSMTLELDQVPRIGEGVRLGRIKKGNFGSQSEFKKYSAEEYEFRQWKVQYISWVLNSESPYMVVTLEEDVSKRGDDRNHPRF